MRILFISNLYPPHGMGGMEQRCEETVNLFQRRGHTCHVLTSRYAVQHREIPEEGITRALHLQADVDHYRLSDLWLVCSRNRVNRLALQRVLRCFRPDLVFIWGMWNLSPEVAYWAEKELPGKVAYSIASYWLTEPGIHLDYWQRSARNPRTERLKSLARPAALAILAQERRSEELGLEHVVCVSKHVRRRLLEANLLPNGCRVIYNGIDPEPFVNASRSRTASNGNQATLIYVGGILPHKGVQTAIEALGLLEQRSQGDRLHLELIGGGHPDYVAQLHQRVADLGLSHRVTFHGRKPREEIPKLLAQAHIFLFTSTWEEPIARSVMEAMAAGLAVIATPVGGQREMLEDGVNALLYRPDDADQLAACIQRLRDDRDLCTKLGAAGRRTVLERFTLDRMANEMESWLQSIIAGSGAPPEPVH